MRQTVLLGTGPLVSFLAAGLEHHEWVVEQWKRLENDVRLQLSDKMAAHILS